MNVHDGLSELLPGKNRSRCDVDKLNEKVAMLANIFHTCGWHTAKSGDFDQVGEAYSQTKWLWVAMTMTMTIEAPVNHCC